MKIKSILFVLLFGFISLNSIAGVPVSRNSDSPSLESADVIIADSGDIVNFDSTAIVASNVNWGGFFLGLLLGLLGVIFAHIFSTDKQFKKSSWMGFGTWLIILLVLGLL